MRKQRNFTAEFKAKVVMQNITGEKSASEICREHRLNPVLFSRWKSEFIANVAGVFEKGGKGNEAQARMAELERLVGKLALENEILKNRQFLACSGKQKREIILKLKDTHSIRSTCQALDYPRSSFYYRPVEGKDELLMYAIQETAGERPTYGYRRITAQLQRQGWQV